VRAAKAFLGLQCPIDRGLSSFGEYRRSTPCRRWLPPPYKENLSFVCIPLSREGLVSRVKTRCSRDPPTPRDGKRSRPSFDSSLGRPPSLHPASNSCRRGVSRAEAESSTSLELHAPFSSEICSPPTPPSPFPFRLCCYLRSLAGLQISFFKRRWVSVLRQHPSLFSCERDHPTKMLYRLNDWARPPRSAHPLFRPG